MDFQTLIIGAGISGIGAGIMLDKHKLGSYAILEAADDVGGTWRVNDYPGIAVDIPSFAYQFSFESNYKWSKLYAGGKEIKSYLDGVVDKYALKKNIRFNTAVENTQFNNENGTWTVNLKDGSSLTSKYLIAATGIFHKPIFPNIKGRDSFKGKVMHPSQWDHSYDYKGKKVGIIGTGASAVQLIPTLAPDVERLTVFQRTPIWIFPKGDVQFSEEKLRQFKETPEVYKKTEKRIRFSLNLSWKLMMLSYLLPFKSLSKIPFLWKLRQEVKDPETRKKLTPKYGVGCKRPAISDDYWPAFNRENVDLTVEGIEEITETGVRTKDGKEVELDFLILSTGYKTTEKGNFPNFDIIGDTGVSLADYWDKEGYQSYNGIAVPGFSNLFLTSGPFSFGLNWYDQLESNLHLTKRVMEAVEQKNSSYVSLDPVSHAEHHKISLKKMSRSLQLSSICVGSNSYYIDSKGQNTLPAVVTPNQRRKDVTTMPLDGFVFN